MGSVCVCVFPCWTTRMKRKKCENWDTGLTILAYRRLIIFLEIQREVHGHMAHLKWVPLTLLTISWGRGKSDKAKSFLKNSIILSWYAVQHKRNTQDKCYVHHKLAQVTSFFPMLPSLHLYTGIHGTFFTGFWWDYMESCWMWAQSQWILNKWLPYLSYLFFTIFFFFCYKIQCLLGRIQDYTF